MNYEHIEYTYYNQLIYKTMKNFKLLSMLLAAASLLLASCSIDNLSSNEINDGEECLVSFAIQIPGELGTKSRIPMDPPEEFPDEEEPELNLDPEPEPTPEEPGPLPVDPEDPDNPTEPVVEPIIPGGGTMVKKLSYYVYKEATAYDEYDYPYTVYKPTETYGTIDITDLTTSVDIILIKGVKYRIAFWADAFGLEGNPNSPFIFDKQTARLSIDFDKVESNREDLDAFWAIIDIESPATGLLQSVVLTRPFAQLNIGADLSKVEQLAIDKNSIATGIEVKCGGAISLIGEWWNDVAYEDITTHTFKIAPRPTNYRFPVEPETYEYLCMNYILVPYHEFEEESVVPVTFSYDIDGTTTSRTINVPLERNHRTNIYGDLLTATSKVNITINPMFSQYHGEHNYEKEQELSPLHEAAKNGGVFELTEDLILSQPVIVPRYVRLTVDLNRYTISKISNETGINNVFELESGASLTIKGFGQVKAIGENSSNYIAYGSSGSYLNIYGGSYDGGISMYSNNVTLYGGAFKNCNSSNLRVANDLKLAQVGDWQCVIKQDFDTSNTPGGWLEDWEAMMGLISIHTDNHVPNYLHSNNGVTYIISRNSMEAIASASGTAIDLGLFNENGPFTFVINDGITEICDYAFSSAVDLAYYYNTITLPSTLNRIGNYAFAYCMSLESLDIPENVTVIGEAAFKRCWNLQDINIPDGVTRIEKETFEYTDISSIELPNSVNYIGENAFYGCGSLQSVTMSNNITEIGEAAFKECNNLRSINIPRELKRIEKEAFENTAISSIELPDSVNYIGENAFYRCGSLQSVTMTDNVSYIGKAAFRSCRNLRNINISNRIARIESETFKGAGLSTIDFPESVKYFGSECFTGSYLTTIIIRSDSFRFEDDSIFWGKNFTESDYNFITLYVHPNMVSYVKNMFPGILENYVWVNTLDELEE